MDIATLSADHLDPLVGETVTAATAEGPLALRLERVTRHSARPETQRTGFALTLTGPRTPVLGQGNWALGFPGLGTLTLFLSPFAQDEDSTRYEIIFN